MSRRRLILGGIAVAAVAGGVVPAFAQSVPVTVTHDTHNGVSVGVQVNNQPGAGANVSNGEACAGIGDQVPACVAVPGIVHGAPAQSLPVTVRHDDNGTAVGVGVVGVVVSNDGRVCPGVSTQDWPCVGGNG